MGKIATPKSVLGWVVFAALGVLVLLVLVQAVVTIVSMIVKLVVLGAVVVLALWVALALARQAR